MKSFLIILLVLFVNLLPTYSQKQQSFDKTLNSVPIHSEKTETFDQNNLQVNWQLISNNYQKEENVLCSFKFTNTGKTDLPDSGWTIYFNSFQNMESDFSNSDFIITHLNGDLYQIKPTKNFKGLKLNQSVDFNFLMQGEILNLTRAPSGLYIVWDANKEKGYTIKNYIQKPIVDPSINFITPEILYNNNKVIENTAIENLPKIFPTPEYFKEIEGTFILDKKVAINADSQFLKEAKYLSNELAKVIEGNIVINPKQFHVKQIVLKYIESDKEEAYVLDVQSDKIVIEASTSKGVFYGIQSLKSLFPATSWKTKSATISINNCSVKDAPRFELRSFMLDVARNFQTKETIFKILDAMSLYKMNTFHFHFSDDEGWRIAIPSLPELTEIGSKRGHTLESYSSLPVAYGSGPETGTYPGSGFYSREDFVEILKYATERHIQVIPEIESPGHSRAAIKAMDFRYNKFMKVGNQVEAERYLLRDINDKSVHNSAQNWTDNVMCVALPSTYNFLEKVIDEILAMYNDANAPISTIHLGGDEVPAGTWELSPLCNKLIAENSNLNSTDDLWYYYFDKMQKVLEKRNLFVSGWEEIAMRKTTLDGSKTYIPNPDFANKGFRAYVWNNAIGWGSEDLPYKLANAGYKVVLSCVTNLYFDLPYEKSPDEIGHYWAGFNDIDKPFYFIPFDYYKNNKEDSNGNPIEPDFFKEKERLTDFGKSNILGIQGQLFSENVRSTKILEYLLFPKLLALAERAWAENPAWATEVDKEKSKILYDNDWSVFVNVLGKKELPRLDYYAGGFGYRIPAVGIMAENGQLRANIQMPGFTIRYTTDGSEPTNKSKIYLSPIAKKGKITFCAFASNGRKGRITSVENK